LRQRAVLGVGLFAGCHGKSVNDYLNDGDAAMQRTETAAGRTELPGRGQAAPNDPRVHVALGNLYVFEQKPTLAQAEFMHVLELQPAKRHRPFGASGLYESQSQMGAAEEQYRAAVALKPADPAYRLRLGTLLAKVNRPGGRD